MHRTVLSACLVAAGLALSAPSRAADYTIDPSHTHVVFMVDHLGFSKMIGLFVDTSGTVTFDPANVAASKVSVSMSTASLATQFEQRDKDLKGADWFNVTEFPDMKFVGTAYSKTGDKTGTMTGNLTLLGVTKPVVLSLTFNKQGKRPGGSAEVIGFSARGSLKRSDFGMKTFLPYIGDDVDLIIETEAAR